MKLFASLAIALTAIVFSGNEAEAQRHKTGWHGTKSSTHVAHPRRSRAKQAHVRKHRSVQRRRSARNYTHSDWQYTGERRARGKRATSSRRHAGGQYSGVGPRPARWCGWWMRTQLGGGAHYNLARSWRSYGRSTAPQVGAVVVKGNHVGIITGRSASGGWIVKAGNDGGRVRERVWSLSGASVRI